MHTTGYLASLMLHELLNHETYTRLQEEFGQTRDAAAAEEAAAKK
ncbi:hypothetical protein [Pseudomonas sp. MPC6]|nr:hypothetical protein [Pseudomonas sp. MPC6]